MAGNFVLHLLRWIMKIAAFVVVVAIVIAIPAAVIWGIWYIAIRLPATVAAPTIIGAGAVIVSVSSIPLTNYFIKVREIERESRRRKAQIYEEFIVFMFKIMGPTKPSEEEMQKKFADFAPKIILWGGSDLLQAWIKVRRIHVPSTEGTDMLLVWEKLLLAIRKELGHSNKGLQQWDVLKVFVNDIDDHIPRDDG